MIKEFLCVRVQLLRQMVNEVFSIDIKIRAGFFKINLFYSLSKLRNIRSKYVIITLILMLVLAEQYTTESSEQAGE